MTEARYPGGEGRRYSQSTVEQYLRCGLAHLYSTTTQHRRLTTRMAIGSAVAWGAQADARTKKATGGGALPPVDLIEISVAKYDEEIDGAEVPESKTSIIAARDDTAKAARTFALKVSPFIKGVVDAETGLVAKLGGLELAGRPDYITVEGIGDLKTGQPWTTTRANSSRQLTAYGILHRAHYGAYPQRVWIDSVSRGRIGWTAERLWSHRTEEDYRAYWHILLAVDAGIQAGIALPAPEGAWWCSPVYCAHWNFCEAVNSR